LFETPLVCEDIVVAVEVYFHAAASFHQISMNAIHHPVTAMPPAPTPMVATSAHALMGTPETDLVVHVRILLFVNHKAMYSGQ